MSTLLVIGAGLIGCSFAGAARQGGAFKRILGLDNNANNLATALQLGLIDEAVTSLEQGLSQLNAMVDGLLVATPVADIPLQVVKIFRSTCEFKPVVFDCGSVKGRIIDRIVEQLGHLPPNFVPAHPIAGRERHGPAAADRNLFHQQRVILTPTPATDPGAVARVAAWWESCGARVDTLEVAEHDRLLGLTSHLPHLLSFTFVDWIARIGGDPAFDYAAGGFRDFTRVAESDPRLWREIFENNERFLLQHLDSWLDNARAVRGLVRNRQWDDLETLLGAAQRQRLKYRDALAGTQEIPEDE